MSGDDLFKKLAKDKVKGRKPVSVYLSAPLMDQFKRLCREKDVSASKAIEEMVRQLVESNQSRAPSAPSVAPVSGSASDRMTAALEILRTRDDLIDVILDLAKLRATAPEKPKGASKRRVS